MPPPAPHLHVATAAAAVPTCRRYRQSLLFAPLDLKAAACGSASGYSLRRGRGLQRSKGSEHRARGRLPRHNLRRRVGAPTRCAECTACRLGTTRGAVARCDSGGILHGCGCRSSWYCRTARTWRSWCSQRRRRRSQCHSGWRACSGEQRHVAELQCARRSRLGTATVRAAAPPSGEGEDGEDGGDTRANGVVRCTRGGKQVVAWVLGAGARSWCSGLVLGAGVARGTLRWEARHWQHVDAALAEAAVGVQGGDYQLLPRYLGARSGPWRRSLAASGARHLLLTAPHRQERPVAALSGGFWWQHLPGGAPIGVPWCHERGSTPSRRIVGGWFVAHAPYVGMPAGSQAFGMQLA